MKLSGKTAIVTGGSRDIGREVSIALAAEGARIVVNYCNNADDAETTLAHIHAAGGQAVACEADLTTAAGVAHLVATTLSTYGDAIDILVNVTGGMVARKTIDEMDLDFLNHVLLLNVGSTFMMVKAVAPHMPAGSAVVNFASQAGRDGGGPGATAYATSKGAVMTMTRSFAKELGPRGIRVNALCPGMIATSFHDTFTKAEVREAVANGTPLRRQGSAAEVARTVVCLSSDDSSFINGANIDINGGTFFS